MEDLNPKEKAYLEPRHAVQRDCCCDPSGSVEDMHAEGEYGDAHDQFIACLGGDVKPRGGHADAVRAHEQKIKLGVVDNRKHVYGEKGLEVRVKPEPPMDGITCL
jgi:hypothetical protein